MGSRLIVPLAKQAAILKKLHESHAGLSKTNQLAKTAVFWPGINRQIEDLIHSCSFCVNHMKAPCKQPLLPTDIPKHPFHTVGADLFSLNGDDFILVVDYYTKWIVIEQLKTTSSASVIQTLEKTFADYGLVSVLRSDNGPQFSSAQFKQFMLKHEIKHVTSSPGYAQSNGCVERYIQTAKNMMKKCREEGKSFYNGLRALRNTPISDKIPSPAQLLQGRILPDRIPRHIDTLYPSAYDREAIKQEFEKVKSEQKYYYDRKAKSELRVLQPLESVKFKMNDKWIPGTIQKHDETPRSYLIKTSDGKVIRRTRTDIVPVVNSSSQTTTVEGDGTRVSSGLGLMLGMDPPGQPASRDNSNLTNTSVQPSTNHENSSSPYRTRSGRVVRRPDRLICGS
jgi:rRNA-processing protein FCF1